MFRVRWCASAAPHTYRYSLIVIIALSDPPKVVWLVIAALREKMSDKGVARIPENTLVMNRSALASMYGPTLMAWMQLLKEEPIAIGAESAAASASGGGGSDADAAATAAADAHQ